MTDGFYDNRAEIFNVERGSCQCHRTHQDYISIGYAISQEIVCGFLKKNMNTSVVHKVDKDYVNIMEYIRPTIY